jgi:hypothetical protein
VWSLDGVLRPHLHRDDSANSDAAPIAADLDEDA